MNKEDKTFKELMMEYYDIQDQQNEILKDIIRKIVSLYVCSEVELKELKIELLNIIASLKLGYEENLRLLQRFTLNFDDIKNEDKIVCVINKTLKSYCEPKETFKNLVLRIVKFTDLEKSTINMFLDNYKIKDLAKIFNVKDTTIRRRLDRILAKILDNKDLNSFILKKLPKIEEKETLQTLKEIFNIEFYIDKKESFSLYKKLNIAHTIFNEFL